MGNLLYLAGGVVKMANFIDEGIFSFEDGVGDAEGALHSFYISRVILRGLIFSNLLSLDFSALSASCFRMRMKSW